MTAKEYLNRARGLEREVTQLREMKRRAYELATSSTAKPSQAPTHGDGARDVFAAYAQYNAMLEERTAELLDVQRETLQTIERVPDSRYRQLLRARYLENKTWEEIAVQTSYSWRQVLRLHGEALRAVSGMMS